MAIDSYRGRPLAGLPTELMQTHWPHGARSVTCSLEKFGPRMSIAFCWLWCMMMQTWFHEWVNNVSGHAAIYSIIDAPSLLATEVLFDLDSLAEEHPAKLRYAVFLGLKAQTVT